MNGSLKKKKKDLSRTLPRFLSITPPPLACLLPIVHPVAFGSRHTTVYNGQQTKSEPTWTFTPISATSSFLLNRNTRAILRFPHTFRCPWPCPLVHWMLWSWPLQAGNIPQELQFRSSSDTVIYLSQSGPCQSGYNSNACAFFLLPTHSL